MSKKVNERIINRIPEKMRTDIYSLEYKDVTPDCYGIFEPYYYMMNEPWSASTCFLNMIAWSDTLLMYYKISKTIPDSEGIEDGDVLIGICYESNEGVLVGIPFIGRYTQESVNRAFEVLKNDFRTIGVPLIIMDVVKWMLPYYEAVPDFSFDVEDKREYMEYLYSAKAFEDGMNKQDDRYRYRYFMRRFEYETVEITKDSRDEIIGFMEDVWCGDKKCDECQFGCLVEVTDKVVSSFDKINAYGILVRVDGKIAGFCIVTKKMGQAVYQFKHAINRIKGINEYMLRECYERYLQGVDFINYTEDCGIESLRRYKMNLCDEYTLSSRLTLYEKDD